MGVQSLGVRYSSTSHESRHSRTEGDSQWRVFRRVEFHIWNHSPLSDDRSVTSQVNRVALQIGSMLLPSVRPQWLTTSTRRSVTTPTGQPRPPAIPAAWSSTSSPSRLPRIGISPRSRRRSPNASVSGSRKLFLREPSDRADLAAPQPVYLEIERPAAPQDGSVSARQLRLGRNVRQ